MTRSLTKSLLGCAAIAAATALVPVQGANAQVLCRSDGYSWHCQDGYFGPGPAPAWGYQPGWGFNNNFPGDYNQIPNDYPGPAPVYNGR